MAHTEQIEFCKRVKNTFPDTFTGKTVLDCGSFDVNGNNKYLFDKCQYTGIDVVAGPNVDIVSKIHEFRPNEKEVYDVIVSTECFEHDMHFSKSLDRIMELIKRDGSLLITCATTGRDEHGTKTNHPGCSPTVAFPEWAAYYKNIVPEQLLPLCNRFHRSCLEINNLSHDLYFWGLGRR